MDGMGKGGLLCVCAQDDHGLNMNWPGQLLAAYWRYYQFIGTSSTGCLD